MAENEQTLDDLIVSALRFPNEAGKTSAAVTVLDPEKLKERGIYDLTTALSEVPGVIATSTGGQQGAIGGLFIRGTTTAYSQVVVDGMRLSDSTAPLGNFLGTARIDDLSRIEVLVIDDWAMAPMSEAERRDFWEICEDRYQTRSTILTSQLPVARWHEQIGDPTAADGILDRLVHNAHRIEMRGDSMRKKRGPQPSS